MFILSGQECLLLLDNFNALSSYSYDSSILLTAFISRM